VRTAVRVAAIVVLGAWVLAPLVALLLH